MNMKIKYSRHAKRRAKLYGISLVDVEAVLKRTKLLQGRQEITRSMKSRTLSVKIIVDVSQDTVTVITVYPLKRRRSR